jgi:hypothetical protein
MLKGVIDVLFDGHFADVLLALHVDASEVEGLETLETLPQSLVRSDVGTESQGQFLSLNSVRGC